MVWATINLSVYSYISGSVSKRRYFNTKSKFWSFYIFLTIIRLYRILCNNCLMTFSTWFWRYINKRRNKSKIKFFFYKNIKTSRHPHPLIIVIFIILLLYFDDFEWRYFTTKSKHLMSFIFSWLFLAKTNQWALIWYVPIKKIYSKINVNKAWYIWLHNHK